jgi:hypothetical protein
MFSYAARPPKPALHSDKILRHPGSFSASSRITVVHLQDREIRSLADSEIPEFSPDVAEVLASIAKVNGHA